MGHWSPGKKNFQKMLGNPFFYIYFVFQSTFMEEKDQSLQTLREIKTMMERSSRFISLSGLSGIAAGICALAGAYFAHDVVVNSEKNFFEPGTYNRGGQELSVKEFMGSRLLQIGIFTFIGAFLLAFLFTWLKSKKTNTPVWGASAKRLMVNVCVPMIAGGLYIYRNMQLGNFGLIAPGCLIFYGLALVNASKYTLPEIRYLGYGQIILGLINCWNIGNGLYFWAAGFGVLHIIYGSYMWWKYERTTHEAA
jgi:hypothetical protein